MCKHSSTLPPGTDGRKAVAPISERQDTHAHSTSFVNMIEHPGVICEMKAPVQARGLGKTDCIVNTQPAWETEVFRSNSVERIKS